TTQGMHVALQLATLQCSEQCARPLETALRVAGTRHTALTPLYISFVLVGRWRFPPSLLLRSPQLRWPLAPSASQLWLRCRASLRQALGLPDWAPLRCRALVMVPAVVAGGPDPAWSPRVRQHIAAVFCSRRAVAAVAG